MEPYTPSADHEVKTRTLYRYWIDGEGDSGSTSSPSTTSTTNTSSETKSPNNNAKKFKVGSTFSLNDLKCKVTSLNKGKGTIKVTGTTRKDIQTIEVKQNVSYNNYTLTVTAIGNRAFKNQNKMTYIDVQTKKLTKIGKEAFYGCKQLKRIILKSMSICFVNVDK